MPTRQKVAPVRTRRRVSSTCLSVVAYDRDAAELELEFRRSGAVYRYTDVGQGTVTRLLGAGSKGRYFNRNIRNSYEYQRIRGGRRRGRVKRHR